MLGVESRAYRAQGRIGQYRKIIITRNSGAAGRVLEFVVYT